MRRIVLLAGVVGGVALLVGLLALPVASTPISVVPQAVGDPELLVEYPVPGNPEYVAVESPGVVWFTLPPQNLIGRLEVTTTVDYDVMTYTVPLSLLSDIEYAEDKVWFTGGESDAVGCLDPADGSVVLYATSIPGAQIAALDVVGGSPTRIWFVDRANAAIGDLVITDTLDYAATAYPLPEVKFGATPEIRDVQAASVDRIWFTAPGSSAIGNFRPSYWPWSDDAFTPVSDPVGILPGLMAIDAQGYPWFTETTGQRIGKFFPQTIALFDYYPIPSPSPGLFGIAAVRGMIWFTEGDAGKIGYLDPATRTVHEYGVSGSQPLGLDVDLDGHVWVADGGGRILEWRAPYFRRVLLPIVFRYGTA